MDPMTQSEPSKRQTSEPDAPSPNLSPEQQELLRSLDRSLQQVARGETRPVSEFLEELRLEREAEANDHQIVDGIRSPDPETSQEVSSS